MKKTILSIAATFLCVGYGVLSYAIVAHSELPSAENSSYAESCQTNEQGSSDPGKYNMCCLDYSEAMAAAKRDWMANLNNLVAQEIPASKMVDDAYENLRTYNCWLEYICLSVHYSSYAPFQTDGMTSRLLGTVPGCQDVEDMRMEREYNTLLQGFKDVPIAGVVTDAIEQSYVDNRMAYFPRCQTNPEENNKRPNFTLAKRQYDACKEALERQFGCTQEEIDNENPACLDSSTVFVEMENVLKKAHADQKASALERKLGQIVPKMHAMEEHASYLSNFLIQLNQRLACSAPYCQ